jgi:hypothetical protein
MDLNGQLTWKEAERVGYLFVVNLYHLLDL